MTDNKNIIKGNRHVVIKPIKAREFYAIIELKKKNKKGETSTTSVLSTHFGSRLQAKNELNRVAKQMNGEVVYFGAFKNNLY